MTQAFRTATTRTIQVKDTELAYREFGARGGVPVVFLHHLTAVLDDWDPKLLDGIAARHHVVIFDNRGVGGSGGETPASVEAMAQDAIAFIEALGFAKVDLFGFSLGGFVAQAIVQARPELVRKIVLAGTGPAGGVGIADVARSCRARSRRPAPRKSTPNTTCSSRRRATARRCGPVPHTPWDASDRSRQGGQRSGRPGPDRGDRQMGPGAERDRGAGQGLAAGAGGQRRRRRHGADGEFLRAVPSPSERAAQHLPGCEPRGIFQYADAFADQTLRFLAE